MRSSVSSATRYAPAACIVRDVDPVVADAPAAARACALDGVEALHQLAAERGVVGRPRWFDDDQLAAAIGRDVSGARRIDVQPRRLCAEPLAQERQKTERILLDERLEIGRRNGEHLARVRQLTLERLGSEPREHFSCALRTEQQQLVIEHVAPVFADVGRSGIDRLDLGRAAQLGDVRVDERRVVGHELIGRRLEDDIQAIQGPEGVQVGQETADRRAALRQQVEDVGIEGQRAERPEADQGEDRRSCEHGHAMAMRGPKQARQPRFEHDDSVGYDTLTLLP